MKEQRMVLMGKMMKKKVISSFILLDTEEEIDRERTNFLRMERYVRRYIE